MIHVLKSATKRLPVVSAVLDTNLYKRLRHRVSLRTGRRENSTFTGFYRLPSQFEALTGPVIQFLAKEIEERPLEVIVFGSSNGAEPYTISSLLGTTHPDLDFRISAYDIDPEIIEKARSARYSPDEEVYNNRVIQEEFIHRTFDLVDGKLQVRAEIAAPVRFEIADALDPTLSEKVGQADVLFAQNFLFHLEPKVARAALRNLCRLLGKRAALFVDGVDINIRSKVTEEFGLEPLEYRLEEIHNEARRARAVGWPYTYWGLEPYMTASRDWQRRYATIFLKGGRADESRPQASTS
jgi:chemotaxis methyl-accepting protein methylase